jgi:hypothetical protein
MMSMNSIMMKVNFDIYIFVIKYVTFLLYDI